MELICKKCGHNVYTVTPKANNHVANCARCGAFIKNVPHSTEAPTLYIGKYKGRTVASIDDLPYLEWVYGNVTSLKAPVMEAILEQIKRLRVLMR